MNRFYPVADNAVEFHTPNGENIDSYTSSYYCHLPAYTVDKSLFGERTHTPPIETYPLGGSGPSEEAVREMINEKIAVIVDKVKSHNKSTATHQEVIVATTKEIEVHSDNVEPDTFFGWGDFGVAVLNYD